LCRLLAFGAIDSDVDNPVITAVLVNTTKTRAPTEFRRVVHYDAQSRLQRRRYRLPYRDFDGFRFSNVATATITVHGIPRPTVHLDRRAAIRELSRYRPITNDNTPTFFAVTQPFLLVALYATPASRVQRRRFDNQVVGAANPRMRRGITRYVERLARTVDMNSPSSFRADGLSTGGLDAGPLLIDTLPPS